MSAIKLVPKGSIENTSKQVLEEAIALNPEAVIVFCFDGSRVHIKTSGIKSNLELMGVIEAAKQQVWENA